MNPKARHKARCAAMQAIYQWQITDRTMMDVELQILSDDFSKNIDREYFSKVIHGAVDHKTEIDAAIAPHTSRPINDVSPLELAILRLATFELLQSLDIPYRVVLNEAIEMAKKYAAEDSHKFVNGVLDKSVAILREAEINAAKSDDRV